MRKSGEICNASTKFDIANSNKRALAHLWLVARVQYIYEYSSIIVVHSSMPSLHIESVPAREKHSGNPSLVFSFSRYDRSAQTLSRLIYRAAFKLSRLARVVDLVE